MYSFTTSLILGFHGCDREIGEKVLSGEIAHLRLSQNQYDWLGHGIYFWDNNPARAYQFASEAQHRKSSTIEEPFVIGAVIDLGYCLNLLNSKDLSTLEFGYRMLVAIIRRDPEKKFSTSFSVPAELPRNKKAGAEDQDKLLRDLDCAVVETVHTYNKITKQPEFDSVRAVFTEGSELYPDAGFQKKNHIQVCIRNPNCVKGYFRPLLPVEGFSIPR